MAVRLEIALKEHLFDAEGASLCRKIHDYFGWDVGAARVIHIVTLDTGLSGDELEAVRKAIFTNPVTQDSGFQPMAKGFDWAVWVGFRPGVRDTAGSVALEAVCDYLGRPLSTDDAAYTSSLYTLSGTTLGRERVETIARELLANDIIQQWLVFSGSEWDASQGIGLILPKVALAHTPSVVEIPIGSDDDLMQLSEARNLALNPRDIPVIRNYFLRPEVLTARQERRPLPADGRGTGSHLAGPKRPLQPQHLPGKVPLP